MIDQLQCRDDQTQLKSCTRMYEFILESTRLVLNETTTSVSKMIPEMTKQVSFGSIDNDRNVDSNGVGLREVMLNDKNTESKGIQIIHLHILNSVLIINFL